jgi:hypothetical protein
VTANRANLTPGIDPPPPGHRIVVLEWFDVFTFDDPAVITCPDCDRESPELRDVWAAVLWADQHQRRCPA